MGAVRSALPLVEHHGLRLVVDCFIGRKIWGWVWKKSTLQPRTSVIVV